MQSLSTSRPLLLACILAFVFINISSAVYFKLEYNSEVCLKEEFLDDQVVKGNYDATSFGDSISFQVFSLSFRISLKITINFFAKILDPTGNILSTKSQIGKNGFVSYSLQ